MLISDYAHLRPTFRCTSCSEILTHRAADRMHLNVHPAQSGWRAICPNTANNSQYKLERPKRLLIVRLVIPGGGNYTGRDDERAKRGGVRSG